MYATDASNYQIFPQAYMSPFSKDDVFVALEFARLYKFSLLARGGGTSLVGQTIGHSLVLDFTKYMNRILEINLQEKWAIVEPGVVRDVLNSSLQIHQLHFAPDPATSSRATIGGMIANNSSGTRSILYGKTLDHVLELEVLLDDGSIIHCRDLSPEELELKLQQKNKEGELYRSLLNIVAENRNEIEQVFPKVMRRVGGYNLDEFLQNHWNLSKIFVGSEGTLGIILSAKIKLVDNPKHQCLCVVHFNDFYESIAHILEMVKFKPSSVELLDELLMERSRANLETKNYCYFIEGNPKAVQVVEFFGNTIEEATQKANDMVEHLRNNSIGYAYPIFSDKKKIEDIFTVRKKGLGLLMGVKGNRKPIAFIEDSAVPLEYLADYIHDVFTVCQNHQTPVVAYAHASVGLLHVKPLLDLRDQEDIDRMKKISEETLLLVKKYKGSWSGEHGDGIARGFYNKQFFGDKLYKAFIELKNSFDPHQIFNPEKIIHSPRPDQNLRYGPTYQDDQYISKYHYRSEGGFHDSVHLCNGVGECRKLNGGTMCPSFRITMDEKDSTRGRANTLRLALSGQLDSEGLDSEALSEALKLCLACKACKSECPSNVDMSKLKSEILYVQRKNKISSLTEFLVKHQHSISEISAGKLSGLVNATLRSKVFRILFEKISGLDSRRILPIYANKKFKNQSPVIDIKENTVVLFADTYIRYHHPSIGHSAKKVLEQLGYHVLVLDKGCCQRPAMSKGLLDVAQSEGLKTLQRMEPFLTKGIPVLICEPSCASAFKDDLIDLQKEEKWLNLSENIFLIEDFLVSEFSKKKLKKKIKFKYGNYLLHGHCHQKALFTTKSLHQLMSNDPSITIRELNTGCCGMAGSFGYEKSNYSMSEKLAKLSLIPEIENSDSNTRVIATGFSCRHQIDHFSDRTAMHWLEAVDIDSENL